MSQRNDKNDGNGDTLSDSDVAALEANQATYDPETNTVYDYRREEMAPANAQAVIRLTEDPPAGSEWGKASGFDALGMPSTVRIEPNTLGQPPLSFSETGTPPGAFDRPGTAIDSDGLMGTPAELQAQKPDPLDSADGENWIAGSGVSPRPDALAEARGAGADLWSRLVPSGDGLKADHRAAASGQYVTGPSHPPATPAGPSHEVAQVDMSTHAAASAFIRSRRAPTPPSVPTVRVRPTGGDEGGLAVTIFGRRDADATSAQQAAVIPSEAMDADARSDPAELRADAAQLVAVATADAERGVRDAQARADVLLAEATQLEADQAERERVGAYLAAVEHGQGALAQTVTAWERATTALAQATTERDAQRQRKRQAQAEAEQASRQLRSLADGGADFHAIKSARIDLAAAEDVPRLLAPSVERAEGTVTQCRERLGENELAVRRAWVGLQNLSATEGVERPACVPAPRSSLAEKLAEFARMDAIMRAPLSPAAQQERALRAARRDAARRVLPPELDPLTRAGNAAAAFLANQYRG